MSNKFKLESNQQTQQQFSISIDDKLDRLESNMEEIKILLKSLLDKNYVEKLPLTFQQSPTIISKRSLPDVVITVENSAVVLAPISEGNFKRVETDLLEQANSSEISFQPKS